MNLFDSFLGVFSISFFSIQLDDWPRQVFGSTCFGSRARPGAPPAWTGHFCSPNSQAYSPLKIGRNPDISTSNHQFSSARFGRVITILIDCDHVCHDKMEYIDEYHDHRSSFVSMNNDTEYTYIQPVHPPQHQARQACMPHHLAFILAFVSPPVCLYVHSQTCSISIDLPV